MNKRGYTLIETIVVITILAIFSFVFSIFITQAVDSWLFSKLRGDALGSSRYAINRITSEMRRIKNLSSITVATSSECQFIDLDDNTVDFKQVSDSLYRNADVIITGLVAPSGLNFSYLDSSLNPTATIQNVRVIRIRISVVRNQETVILENSVRVRNK